MIHEIERGSVRSHCVEDWLWKRLLNCRKTDCGMDEWTNEWTNCIVLMLQFRGPFVYIISQIDVITRCSFSYVLCRHWHHAISVVAQWVQRPECGLVDQGIGVRISNSDQRFFFCLQSGDNCAYVQNTCEAAWLSWVLSDWESRCLAGWLTDCSLNTKAPWCIT